MNILDEFDSSKFKLGNLCQRNHEYNQTGKSLRYISTNRCVDCKKSHDASFRQKQDKQKAAEYNKEYRSRHKEKLAKQSKEYWENNREDLLKKKKEYYESNKESLLSAQKAYKDKNREEINRKQREKAATRTKEQKEKLNAYHRDRYRQNIEKQRERSYLYRTKNPDKRAETCRNYRHSHRNIQNIHNELRRDRLSSQSDGTMTPEFLSELFARHSNCVYCNADMVESATDGEWGKVKTLDHLIPLAMGGLHSAHNSTVCCRQCNIKKGARAYSEWLDELDSPHKERALALYVRNHGAPPEQQTLPLIYK